MTKDDVLSLVNRQAKDAGLWFVAESATESYLQDALRQLHAAIEADAQPAVLPVSWAGFIHYPDCWDSAAYPTLRDAILECLAWSGCSVCRPAIASQPSMPRAHNDRRPDTPATGPPGHPEPHTFAWTRLERDAIVDYGKRCFDAGQAAQPSQALEAAQAEMQALKAGLRTCVGVKDSALARLAKIQRMVLIDPPHAGTWIEVAQIIGASPPPVQPSQAHGRTNRGDETGGAVERFGWAYGSGKPEIVPATNGAFVWYSDYLKLWNLAAINAKGTQ